MNAELKQKWLEALRSGRYAQGKGVLRDSKDRYCCLGVLCDVVDPAGWGDVRLVDTYVGGLDLEVDAYPYRADDDASETTLPYALWTVTGLRPTDISALIVMNDDGKRFSTIAAHIEANIPAEEAQS